MKTAIKFLYTLLVILIPVRMMAQDSTYDFTFSLVMPANVDNLSASEMSKLESKVMHLITSNGIGAVGYSQSFVIYPKFEIYQVQNSSAGMRSVSVADCNLSIFIKQVSTNAVFGSWSRDIKGSGSSRNQAIMNALNQVRSTDPGFEKFISDAREKITAYYVKNCSAIMQQADAAAHVDDFGKALSLYLSIPIQATECFATANAKTKAVYQKFQAKQCSQYLQKAKAYKSADDYTQALKMLMMVDPKGPCGRESEVVIRSIEGKIDAERRQEWEFLLLQHSDEIALEKARLAAMSEIAAAWAKSQPSKISYVNIIQ
jgi:hypothetical protein